MAAITKEELGTKGQALVDGTNDTSKKTMVFVTYVQVRAKEMEGTPKGSQMADAVAGLSANNQKVVDGCNALIKEQTTETRTGLATPVDDIERVTREILGTPSACTRALVCFTLAANLFLFLVCVSVCCRHLDAARIVGCIQDD